MQTTPAIKYVSFLVLSLIVTTSSVLAADKPPAYHSAVARVAAEPLRTVRELLIEDLRIRTLVTDEEELNQRADAILNDNAPHAIDGNRAIVINGAEFADSDSLAFYMGSPEGYIGAGSELRSVVCAIRLKKADE